MNTIFDQYYEDNYWGNLDSVSGNGSDLEATEHIRAHLVGLFLKLGIRDVVDLGCGDYYWWKEMDLPAITYLGLDTVNILMQANQLRYGDERHRFRTEHISYPDAFIGRHDLVFCRDVMVHMPNAAVKQTLHNIKKSGSIWLLATTFPARRDDQPHDIIEGQWRPLNLEIMWGLPKPKLLINEGCTIPGYEDKSLGLWKLA